MRAGETILFFIASCCLIGLVVYLVSNIIEDGNRYEAEIELISNYYEHEEVIKIEKLASNKYLVVFLEEGSDTYNEEILLLNKTKINEPTVDKVFKKE